MRHLAAAAIAADADAAAAHAEFITAPPVVRGTSPLGMADAPSSQHKPGGDSTGHECTLRSSKNSSNDSGRGTPASMNVLRTKKGTG